MPPVEPAQGPILVIEDCDEDFEMLALALARHGAHNELVRCRDGEAAFAVLGASAGPGTRRPILVLLDLNVPGADGRELLRDLRARPRWRRTPVVVLSTSNNARDVDFCYAAGANGYAVKPVGLSAFEDMVGRVAAFWLRCAALPTV